MAQHLDGDITLHTYPLLGETPAYDRDALPPGPFRGPPFELHDRRHQELAPEGWATLSEHQKSAEYGLVWLLGALDAHGIALDRYDCEVALVIAEEGLSLVQVVSGWIARAVAAERARVQT